MTINELNALLAKHNLMIDSWSGGAGNFRDLYIGTGLPYNKLYAALNELKQNLPNRINIFTGNNLNHPSYGKQMIEIHSFWWE